MQVSRGVHQGLEGDGLRGLFHDRRGGLDGRRVFGRWCFRGYLWLLLLLGLLGLRLVELYHRLPIDPPIQRHRLLHLPIPMLKLQLRYNLNSLPRLDLLLGRLLQQTLTDTRIRNIQGIQIPSLLEFWILLEILVSEFRGYVRGYGADHAALHLVEGVLVEDGFVVEVVEGELV